MNGSNTNKYVAELARHYEDYFGVPGKRLKLNKGPIEKIHHPSYGEHWQTLAG